MGIRQGHAFARGSSMAHATEFVPLPAPSGLGPCWLSIVFVVALVGHRHDTRSLSLVDDRAVTDNECVHCTRAYKHVSKRCLEVGQPVENEWLFVATMLG
jgi:hypothetical protein